jgi:hypothetical protein
MKALTPHDAAARAADLKKMRGDEKVRLDRIRDYLSNDPSLTWLPTGVPEEVRALAKLARVNMLKLVVDSVVQSLYVDGYTSATSPDAARGVWEIWQRNRMDARQIGIHRAAASYGAAYGIATPGDPVPVLRGASPRNCTAAYGDDEHWPEYVLERRRSGRWWLYDSGHAYPMKESDDSGALVLDGKAQRHGLDVCPVVRFLPTEDLDEPVVGEVEPLFVLQDQINVTTFLLLVAQHYGAHKQRYILGWMAKNEEERLKTAAGKLWTIPKKPGEVEVGEFDQTDLKGYIESREATLRHLAVISQTPANELLGQIVQVSAEALDAVNASNARKITERQTVLGEGHEQLLGQAGTLHGIALDPLAEVNWRDTEQRRLPTVVNALAVLAEKVGVPVEQLWEMVPGVSQSQVRRWRAATGDDQDREATGPDATDEGLERTNQPAAEVTESDLEEAA